MKRLINFVPYFIIVTVLGCILVLNINSVDSVDSEFDGTPLIIIDAGHGGMDGGAVASDGTPEQHINLDIALKLESALKEKGFRTLLTRSDNNSIHDENAITVREQKVSDIHNRLKIIESNPDSIFVSVHQNHYSESKYHGTQVFYSENNPGSSILAQCIQTSVVNTLQPDNTRKIKPSGTSIYLLYHSAVPSVMVECGFLSNPEETEKLKDEKYRQQLADAICDGIYNYILSACKMEQTGF